MYEKNKTSIQKFEEMIGDFKNLDKLMTELISEAYVIKKNADDLDNNVGKNISSQIDIYFIQNLNKMKESEESYSISSLIKLINRHVTDKEHNA